MELIKTLENLRAAKKAHIRWVSYAEALHMGLPLDNAAAPVIPTECEFGSWYYEGGQTLNHLEEFRVIEQPHRNLHNIYMKIYQVKRTPIKVGLFASKNKAKKEKQGVLDSLIQQMMLVSDDLIHKISDLEEELCKEKDNLKVEAEMITLEKSQKVKVAGSNLDAEFSSNFG